MLVSKKRNEVTEALTEKVLVESAAKYNSHALRDDSIELDAIERLKSNILMLEDLQNRLRFMNTELESLIGLKKKKS